MADVYTDVYYDVYGFVPTVPEEPDPPTEGKTVAFEDLTLPDVRPIVGRYDDWVIGSHFRLPIAITDTDGVSLMSFPPGQYVARMTLNLADGTDVLNLDSNNGDPNNQVVLYENNAQMSLRIQINAGTVFPEAYLNQPLVYNLLVSRLSPGLTATVMRECYIVPRARYGQD